MFYCISAVVCILTLCTVDGSKENLPEPYLNDQPLKSSALQQVEKNTIPITKNDLRRDRHKLRMSLMAKRSPSIYPPSGERRRQLELKLVEIDQALKQTPQ